MAGSDREFIERSARIAIIGIVTAGVVLLLFWTLKAALTPLAAAFVIAYLLDPVIDRFERLRVRRGVAIFVLIGVFGGVLLGFVAFVFPRLQEEVASLANRLPGYVDHALRVWLPQLERGLGLSLPDSLLGSLEQLTSGELPLPFEALGRGLTGIGRFLTGTVGTVVGMLVIPVLTYYLLVDFDHLGDRLGNLIPPRHREYVREKLRLVDTLISSFLRGQLLVAGILGFLYAVGFSVIGIDLAIGIGLVAGALALIPYLGNAVALGAASILCVLKFGFDVHLALVVGWYAVVQTAEGFFLTPRIVGQTVGLHPAVVILALLIAGDLLGFLGLLIAVPAAAVIKVFLGELMQAVRESSLYSEEEG